MSSTMDKLIDPLAAGNFHKRFLEINMGRGYLLPPSPYGASHIDVVATDRQSVKEYK